MAQHLLVAHFAAGPLGHKSCVVAGLLARRLSCSDFRLASHVSHSRTERALQLASRLSTSSPAQRCWSCQSCPAPMHHMARSYADSPNMKVDRISTLYNSSLYTTRCLRARHIEIVIHSRKTPSSLRAPPDCRGESVCVGIAREKV